MKSVQWALWLVLFFPFLIIAQADYRITQYTTDHGLPSNECHDVVQDSLGYIWIATDRGLCRFDGYGIKTYGIDQGLEDISCMNLFLDHKEQLWISTYSKRIFLYLKSIDSIVPYKYNQVLMDYANGLKLSSVLHIDNEKNLYLHSGNKGILKIDNTGVISQFHSCKDHGCSFTYEIEDKIYLSHLLNSDVEPEYFEFNDGKKTVKTKLFHRQSKVNYLYDNNYHEHARANVAVLGKDTIVVFNSGYWYLFENDKPHKVFNGPSFRDIKILPNSKILMAGLFNQGLRLYESYDEFINDNSKFHSILPNVSVSRLILGKDENLFITSLNGGFYFLTPTAISVYNSIPSIGQKISSIEKYEDDEIAFVTNNAELWIDNVYPKKAKSIFKSTSTLSDINYSKEFQNSVFIADINNSTFWNELGLFNFFHKANDDDRISSENVKEINEISNQDLYCITGSGFTIYRNNVKNEIFNSSILSTRIKVNGIEHFFGNHYFLACVEGLYSLDIKAKKITKLDSIHPVLSQRFNDIVKTDSCFYLASQGYGLIKWDGIDEVRIINKESGLVSNNIERLYIDDVHDIYACTFSGLSKITIGKTELHRIQNFTVDHGLLSNNVYDCVQQGDKTFVATGSGISLLASIERPTVSQIPELEYVEVNNELVRDVGVKAELSHLQNNINIYYKSLNLNLRGNVNYSYKINEDDWTETTNTFVNFARLQPGNYTFSVKAANRDGLWSPPTQYNFEISKPWWKTNLFILLCFLTLFYIIYTGYRARLNYIQNQNDVLHKLTELERSALQAQMNPHFIFNCLNSIQNFIIMNNKDQAMEYLSLFAKLIRQNLNASKGDLVSLDTEISMLTNYMELEKMRLNNSFEYNIVMDENLDSGTIEIPPLLIQPFVENAIIHGMKAKRQGGLITISFSQKENNRISVVITDNGSGLKAGYKSAHQSMGMSITQKRLSFINKSSNDQLQIIPLEVEEGTSIKISIKA